MKLQCELDHKTQEVAKLQAENNRLIGLIDFHKKESTDRAIKLRNLDKEIKRLKKQNAMLRRLLSQTELENETIYEENDNER
jgi:hypothetical protein